MEVIIVSFLVHSYGPQHRSKLMQSDPIKKTKVKEKMVKSPYFTLVAQNSHLTSEPKADGALILSPLPLHQCSILWVFKAT